MSSMVQFVVLFLYLYMDQCHQGLDERVIEISPMHLEQIYINIKMTNLWH